VKNSVSILRIFKAFLYHILSIKILFPVPVCAAKQSVRQGISDRYTYFGGLKNDSYQNKNVIS